MRAGWIVPVAALVGVATRLVLGGDARADAAPDRSELVRAEAPDAERLARLEDSLATVQASVAELSQRIGARLQPPRRAAVAGLPEAAVEAAARAWLAEHVPAAEPHGARPGSVAAMPIEEIQDYLRGRRPFDTEAQLFYEELRDAGRIDEVVEAAHALALDQPNDPDAQVSLGLASLQALFGLGATPEAGMLAMQADQAFDRALELDPKHVGARFAKAVSLANWPTFMGKTPEAIEHFEVLIEQTSSPGDERALPAAHTFLGSLYERIGEHDQALATWRAGLERWPDSEDLRRQVELAEGTGGEE